MIDDADLGMFVLIQKKVVDRIWIIVYFVATPKIIYDDITSDGCPLSDEAHQNLKSDQKRKYATFKSLYILSLYSASECTEYLVYTFIILHFKAPKTRLRFLAVVFSI